MASPDSAAKSAAASATSAAASAQAAATALEETVNVFGLPSEAAAQVYNIENDPGVKAALSASIAGSRTPATITWSNGLPATETIPLDSGGSLVKTYTYNADSDPQTCAWDYPTGTDYVETFTYDSNGNPTGSTFAEA